MNLLPVHPFAAASARKVAPAHALTVLWRAIVGALRHARAREQHDPIDDASLRDLGIGRAELSSFRAEAEGRVDATRLHAAHPGARWI